MTAHDDGTVNTELRSKWPHEALDFTPWLAKNLNLLGAELGLNLELVQTERQVGTMRLDILAKETTSGALVAIENQLEWTDIHHLGQLVIYSAGVDAKIGIWIVAGFTEENARALHKLNEWSGDEISFYGVKIELIPREGEGEPGFSKVVYPGGWDKGNTLPPIPPLSPQVQKYNDFFQPLTDDLLGRHFADKFDRIWGHFARHFPSKVVPYLWFEASLDDKWGATVGIHIRTTDSEMTNRIFDLLAKGRTDIEKSIDARPDAAWQWLKYDRYAFSSIDLGIEGSIDDPPEKLDEIRAWMLDLLPQFKEEFEPRLERILSELSTNGE